MAVAIDVDEKDIQETVEQVVNSHTLELDPATPGFTIEDALFVNEQKAHEYICSICQCVCEEPCDIGCDAGHIFCKQCIDDYINEKKQESNPSNTIECPDCHSNVKLDEITSNRFVKRQIQTLRIKCPNFTQYKCNWIGTMKNVEKHVKDDCPFSKVICPLCKDKNNNNNNGNKEILRKNIKNHLINECKYLKIKCKNSIYGCKIIDTRENMVNHLKNECKFIFDNENDAMKYRICLLETRVETQNKDINAMTNEINLLKDILNKQTKEIEKLTKLVSNNNNNDNINVNFDEKEKEKEKEKENENGNKNKNENSEIIEMFKNRSKKEYIYNQENSGIKIMAYSIYVDPNHHLNKNKSSNDFGTRIVVSTFKNPNQFPPLLRYDGMAYVDVQKKAVTSEQYNGIVSKKSLITMKNGQISDRMNKLFHKNIEYVINMNINDFNNFEKSKYDSFLIGTKLFDLYQSNLLPKCINNNIDSVIIPLDMAICSNWFEKSEYPLQVLACILTDVIKAVSSYKYLYKMKEIMFVAKNQLYFNAIESVIPMFFDNFHVLN